MWRLKSQSLHDPLLVRNVDEFSAFLAVVVSRNGGAYQDSPCRIARMPLLRMWLLRFACSNSKTPLLSGLSVLIVCPHHMPAAPRTLSHQSRWSAQPLCSSLPIPCAGRQNQLTPNCCDMAPACNLPSLCYNVCVSEKIRGRACARLPGCISTLLFGSLKGYPLCSIVSQLQHTMDTLVLKV